MRRVFLHLCLLLFAATMVVGSPVWAGPDPAKVKAASESFAAGARAFEASRWSEAAAHFEAADAAAPNAKALDLAIKSRKNAGQIAAAATLSSLALERYPDDVETRKTARSTLDEFSLKLHRLMVSCSTACLLVAGEKIVHGEPATRWTVYLDPGKVTIGASFTNKVTATDQTVTATAGGSSVMRFAPAHDVGTGGAAQGGAGQGGAGQGGAAAGGDQGGAGEGGSSEQPPETTSTWRIHPAFFFVGLAVTAGLGGTTIWSGVDTLNDPGTDRVREECAGQGEECQLYKDAQAKELRTNALIGATAGAAAITLVLGIVGNWGGDGDKPAEAPTKDSAARQRAVTFDPPRLWVDYGDAKGKTGVHLGVGGRF